MTEAEAIEEYFTLSDKLDATRFLGGGGHWFPKSVMDGERSADNPLLITFLTAKYLVRPDVGGMSKRKKPDSLLDEHLPGGEAVLSVLRGEKDEVTFDVPSSIGLNCMLCGCDEYTVAFNGEETRVLNECEWKERAFQPAVFRIEVPSGVVMVNDNLRMFFEHLPREKPTTDLNSTAGLVLEGLSWAPVGLAHAFVGNSCPGIFKAGAEKYIIGSFWDYEGDKETPPPDSERVGGICTDLWWYSFADVQLCKANIDTIEDPKEKSTAQQWYDVLIKDDCHRLHIGAGTWEFTHYYCIPDPADPYRDELDLFATFEKV